MCLEGVRAAGVLAFLGGLLLLAGAIGLGRASLGPHAGLAVRYSTLAAMFLPAIYLVCETYGGRGFRRHLPRVLLVLGCVAAAVNGRKALNNLPPLHEAHLQSREDVGAGLPVEALAIRYAEAWGYPSWEPVARWLDGLRDAGLAPFDGPPVDADPALVVLPMNGLRRAPASCEVVRLAAGQEHVQAFTIEGQGRLTRIDFLLSGRRRHAPDHLAWTLRDGQSNSPGELLAQGQAGLENLGPETWLSLPLPALPISGRRHLVLHLRSPNAPHTAPLNLPLYRSEGEADAAPTLKAFVFLRSSGR